jgi:phosphatidylglycerol:prolipoprotein diacylglycerol transferase
MSFHGQAVALRAAAREGRQYGNSHAPPERATRSAPRSRARQPRHLLTASNLALHDVEFADVLAWPRNRVNPVALCATPRRHSSGAPFHRKCGCWSGSCLASGAFDPNNGDPVIPPQEPACYHLRGAAHPADSDFAMPLLVIPYPTFDPVLVHLGPFAIRWYALAYIFGILIGWVYARVLIRSQKLWGGKAPMTVADFDDFVVWVTLGIILGGRIGYVLFYNLPHFAAHPLEIFQLWSGGMSFHGGFSGCVVAVLLFATSAVFRCSRSATSLAQSTDRCFWGARQFHQWRIVGRLGDVPWAMIFPSADHSSPPSQLYEAVLRAWCCSLLAVLMLRRASDGRVIIGCFAGYAIARTFANSFASPTPSSASCGAAPPWASCCRCRFSSPASVSLSTRCGSPRSGAASAGALAARNRNSPAYFRGRPDAGR